MRSVSPFLLLFMLAAATLNGACKAEGRKNVTEVSQSSKEIEDLRTDLGIAIPEGTRVLGVERESGMDDRVRAKLELGKDAFDRLAPSLPIKLEQLRPGPCRLGSDRGFWNPDATPGLRSGQVQMPSARYFGLGVAEVPGDRVVLFVLNHGT